MILIKPEMFTKHHPQDAQPTTKRIRETRTNLWKGISSNSTQGGILFNEERIHPFAHTQPDVRLGRKELP